MVARNGLEVKLYDLVRTEDGHYGIVTGDRTVALGDGCEAILSDEELAQLVVMPLNLYHIDGQASNFIELFEGRVPSQLERAEQIKQFQRELSADLT